MSGRGTITSRTTVSPNSMIERMKARSSVSITSPSTATSAMASSSDSVTPDPRYWPCSPMSRLARPISAPDTIRTGQNRTTAETSGALNRAARSGWCTAQFFGTASPSTKMTTISNTVAAATPQAPNQLWARIPTRVATTSWQMRTMRRTGLRNPWGFSVSRTSDLRPSAAVVHQGQGLGPAHADQARLGQRQHGRHRQQHQHHDEQDPVAHRERAGGDQHAVTGGHEATR